MAKRAIVTSAKAKLAMYMLVTVLIRLKRHKVSLVDRSNLMWPQIGRKIVHKSVQISPVLYQKRAIVTSAKAKNWH